MRSSNMNETEVKEVPAQAEEPATAPKQYTVGYGKAPKSTQFKPGQSGNPKGRTKGSKNGIYTYIQRELNSSITLTDGSKITKEQGFAKQLTNKHYAVISKAKSYYLTYTKRANARIRPNYL